MRRNQIDLQQKKTKEFQNSTTSLEQEARKLRDFEKQSLLFNTEQLTKLNQPVKEIESFQILNGKFLPLKELKTFISSHLRPYEIRFIAPFYTEIFRLNRWDWNPRFRPFIVSKWTRQLIYARFPKEDINKILINNPFNEFGFRYHKHHQWLNDDGIKILGKIINDAILIMKESQTWDEFEFNYRMKFQLNAQTRLKFN